MKHITLNLNGKFMPVDRGEMFEIPLHDFLEKNHYGEVNGGGTSLFDTGDVDTGDVEIYLNETVDIDKVIEEMTDFLAEKVGVPKGSKWKYDDKEIIFGEYEGLGLYFKTDETQLDKKYFNPS